MNLVRALQYPDIARAVALMAALFTPAFAQSVEQKKPAFEVASLKLNTTDARPIDDAANGTLTIRNRSLLNLVLYAYDLDYMRVRGPDWINTVRYDVFAKAAGPVPESQLKLMLQNLLAERMSMKTHREEMPIDMIVMTVGKNGPKGLTPAEEGKPEIEFDKRVRVFRHYRMLDFARMMAGGGSPTLDQTGLPGSFDFRLDVEKFLDPSAETRSMPAFMAATRDAAEAELGLKFEQKKVSVEVLVIDSAEKTPRQN